MAIILWLLAPTLVQAETRLALVIGNGAYREAPLRNPVNDARSMAAALREIGFQVIQVENADRLAMQRAVLDFGRKLDRDAVGLFYYAGHGMQVRGVNYLLPIGAQARSEDEIEVEGVDANYVLARMATAQNRLNIVILDACRDNPFARSFRSGRGGLAAITAPTGTLIAYATAPGATAGDGDGANGLYTGELVRALREPGLLVEEAFKRTRAAVIAKSDGKQVPWESSSLIGDFYFRGAGRPVAAAAPPPSPPAAASAPPPTASVPAAPSGPVTALDCPLPGILVRTSLGGSYTAGRAQGSTCHWLDAQGGDGITIGPFLAPEFRNNGDSTEAMAKLRLDQPGGSVEAMEDDGVRGSFAWHWRVARRETVTVKAGRFDTVVVEAVRTGDRGNHESLRRYWYDPRLRVIVKYQAQAIRGALFGDVGDWEAVEVRPAP